MKLKLKYISLLLLFNFFKASATTIKQQKPISTQEQTYTSIFQQKEPEKTKAIFSCIHISR